MSAQPPAQEPGQDNVPEDEPAPRNGDLFGDDDKQTGKKK